MSLETNRYRDAYHPRIKAEIKKFDLRLKEEIRKTHIPAILENPRIGKKLQGKLSNVYSYHFRYKGQSYRIAYTVDEINKIVGVLKIGKRENFYDILKRRI